MRMGQSRGEGDAGAGNWCAGNVRVTERRLDGNGGRAESPDGGDDGGLGVAATSNGDGLAAAKTDRAGHRDGTAEEGEVGGERGAAERLVRLRCASQQRPSQARRSGPLSTGMYTGPELT